MTDRQDPWAALAQHAVAARLLDHGRTPGVRTRRGTGWTAVCTGVDSNDQNGVVSTAAAAISTGLVEDLVGWFGSAGVPASWVTEEADPDLTRVLVAAGARPERTGSWSGRPLPARAALLEPATSPARAQVQVEVRAVTDDRVWRPGSRWPQPVVGRRPRLISSDGLRSIAGSDSGTPH